MSVVSEPGADPMETRLEFGLSVRQRTMMLDGVGVWRYGPRTTAADASPRLASSPASTVAKPARIMDVMVFPPGAPPWRARARPGASSPGTAARGVRAVAPR